jgi:DNA processing protein
MPTFRLDPDSAVFRKLSRTPRPSPSSLWIEARDAKALELLDRLPEHGLAIVGTREPQPRSEWFTEKFVQGLQASPLIILSGLARGIDSVAHESALDAGLPTIAILGCGLDHQYPPEGRALRERIVHSGGLVISEFAPHERPTRHFFVKRNRLIAAWSQALCVMEAPAKSGALLSADYAMEHHATVFSVPSFPDDPAYAGNQRLIDEYAAIPLWGTHSLGAVWLDLATRQLAFPLEVAKAPRGLRLKISAPSS